MCDAQEMLSIGLNVFAFSDRTLLPNNAVINLLMVKQVTPVHY